MILYSGRHLFRTIRVQGGTMAKKALLTSLLLFGFFFGAGNLIFPPQLGYRAGSMFVPAIFGFVLSGVGIAVVTLLVGSLNPGGYLEEVSAKVSPKYAIVYLAVLFLTIGPLFAIPRTATTSFSIGIQPVVSHQKPALFLFSALYFLSAYLLSINPSKLMSRVGKLLTPIFVLLIISLFAAGIMRFRGIHAAGTISQNTGAALSYGFLEGYNTLDALASVSFCIVASSSIRALGFKDKKEYLSIVTVVGLLVTCFFSFLYVGLGLLGNHMEISEAVLKDPGVNLGAYILTEASLRLFGGFGQFFLGAMTILTCFTTGLGLVVTTSEFFHNNFPKLSYKAYATIFSLTGFGLSNFGLNSIIRLSIPLLMILYPITISIVCLVILNKLLLLSKPGMCITVWLVTVASILEELAKLLHIEVLLRLIQAFPGGLEGFFWISFFLLGLLLCFLLPDKIRGREFRLETHESTK